MKRLVARPSAVGVAQSSLLSSSFSSTTTTCLRSSSVAGIQISSRSYAGSFTKKKKEKKKSGGGEVGEVAEGKRFDEELWKLRPQWVTLTRTSEQLAEEEALIKSYAKVPFPPPRIACIHDGNPEPFCFSQ